MKKHKAVISTRVRRVPVGIVMMDSGNPHPRAPGKNGSLIMREGKTKRDHESGAWARRYENQQTRATWSNSKDASGYHKEKFPKHTCNGKRNRLAEVAKKAA